MQKTLGGDRLGSGKKMKVDLHEYGRSTHDLSYLWRSSASMGTLIPFLSLVGLPGDTLDIDLDVDIKTHPTVGPLFGSAKVQLDVFEIPIRLYQAALHNNKLNAGRDIGNIKFPVLRLAARQLPSNLELDMDNTQINPSCVLHYLGIHGVGDIPDNPEETFWTRDFNAIPLLAYWEIYKNYYANKQETNGFMVHSDAQDAPDEDLQDFIAFGNGQLPEYPSLDEAPMQYGMPRNVMVSANMPGAITEATMDNVKINLNPEGTNFLTLRQLFKGNYTLNGAQIKGQVSLDWGGIVGYSWGFVNQFQPRLVEPTPYAFALEHIDKMREDILEHRPFNEAFVVNKRLGVGGYSPYCFLNWSGASAQGANYLLASQEGLGLKTYQSDMYNNWLNTEWIDGVNGVNARTAVDTSGGSFTMDQLLISEKVFDYLNRVMVAGASYDDWLDATWAVERHRRPESPVYHGSLIRELGFQEVISNAESTDGNQPLGTLGGRGVMTGKRKGGKMVIKPDEPCYIMGIFSVTPRVDYSQGNKWDVHLKSLDDVHKPALDGIGFQDLITEQMAWWDTRLNTEEAEPFWELRSAGKQPAWLNYMTAVNEVHGSFAMVDSEMFMTFNRRYTFDRDEGIRVNDLTTYIDPAKFNHIWADTALDAQNLWVQIACDIEARRIMSAKLMPNL